MLKCPNTNFQFKCKQNNGKQVRPGIGLKNKRPWQTNKPNRKNNKKSTRSRGKVLQNHKIVAVRRKFELNTHKKQNPNKKREKKPTVWSFAPVKDTCGLFACLT